MLSDIQIQEIEQSLNVTLILQSEDMIVFMENETEKQVVLNFAEIVRAGIYNKLHAQEVVINNSQPTYGIYYYTYDNSTVTWRGT